QSKDVPSQLPVAEMAADNQYGPPGKQQVEHRPAFHQAKVLFPILRVQHARHEQDLYEHRAEVPVDRPHEPVALRIVAGAEGVLQVIQGHETMAAIDFVDQPRQATGHLTSGAERQRLYDAHHRANREIDNEIYELGTRFGPRATPWATGVLASGERKRPEERTPVAYAPGSPESSNHLGLSRFVRSPRTGKSLQSPRRLCVLRGHRPAARSSSE